MPVTVRSAGSVRRAGDRRRNRGYDGGERTEEVTMTVRCEQCGQEFEHVEALRAHEHAAPGGLEGGASFECPTCGEAFLQEDDLIEHEATDHADLPAGNDPDRAPDRPESEMKSQGFIKRRLPYPRS